MVSADSASPTFPNDSPQGPGSPEERPTEAAESLEELEARLKAELAPSLQVIRPLGRGAVAGVFLAREPALKRLVAVKVLSPELAQDRTARLRFEREAQSAASISHPNVVGVYTIGRLKDDTPYLVMRHVKGTSVAERLEASGTLPIDQVRRIVTETASGLAAAHKQGIVHRDIKPANILYDEETGRTLLTDFGIAAVLATGEREPGLRLTKTGELVGDPRYMSPEQLAGKGVTERSDIYSLGLVGYELLAGRGPYDVSAPGEIAAAHKHDRPRRLSELRPDVDPELEGLLERCLAKKPEHRPRALDILGLLASGEGTSRLAHPAGAEAAGQGVVARLRQRRMPQILIAYAAGAWILLQATDQLVGRYILPELAYQLCLVFVVSALPAVFIVAWYHGGRGHQKVHLLEVILLTSVALIWLLATAFFVFIQ
jgi:serine/threonine-protein kinase